MSGLEELRRLEAEATEGPWELRGGNEWIYPLGLVIGADEGIRVADAEFIVAARNQIPRILDALDAVLALAESAPRFATHEGGNASGIVQADDVIAAITKALEGKQ